MRSQIISDEAVKPISPISMGVKWNEDIIITSGQTGRTLDGKMPEDFTEQAKNALNNLLNVIKAGGGTLDSILKVTVYVTNMEESKVLDTIWKDFFKTTIPPCRSRFQVVKLPVKNSKIVVEGIAGVVKEQNDGTKNSENTPLENESINKYLYKKFNPQDWQRLEVKANTVAILNTVYKKRGMKLNSEKTRAVRYGEIHEVICTDEKAAGPEKIINSIAGLCFMEITQGGLIVAGDQVLIENKFIGEVVGFDYSHMPNHMNIVIRCLNKKSGKQLELIVSNKIKFIKNNL